MPMLVVNISDELHTKIKLMCARTDMTVSNLVRELMTEVLEEYEQRRKRKTNGSIEREHSRELEATTKSVLPNP